MTVPAASNALRPGVLCLQDGTLLRGRAFGAATTRTGEVVFNTSLTGYPEILTDPSYAGQMVTLTQTQVGNYGITRADLEAETPHATGLIVRALPAAVSNWRSEIDLDAWLTELGLPGLCDIDTRALVRHLRTVGSQPGVLCAGAAGQNLDEDKLLAQAKALPGMAGQEWVSKVTCRAPTPFLESVSPLGWERPAFDEIPSPGARPHIVAFDYGAKRNILRLLVSAGFHVTVVPAQATAAEVNALHPDGIFLSNGPGDPATCGPMIREVEKLLGKLPLFGICLGHQFVAHAVGGKTYKLKFGHRGGNQPVQNLKTGRVMVTSQNHGFAVDPTSLPKDVEVSELNLSDGTVEGLDLPNLRAFTVQYHPEAAPGPHDTREHFLRFRRLVLAGSAPRNTGDPAPVHA